MQVSWTLAFDCAHEVQKTASWEYGICYKKGAVQKKNGDHFFFCRGSEHKSAIAYFKFDNYIESWQHLVFFLQHLFAVDLSLDL